jgi:hypothetical protein
VSALALAEAAGRLVVDRDEAMFGEAGAAWFSSDRTYRYLLTRRWGDPASWMTWIMLNPSTADASADDPTIGRCTAFAKREGCGGLDVLNLFAWRAADPRALRECGDPVGPDNDLFITGHAQGALVVAAWGAHAFAAGRAREVGQLVGALGVSLLCLGITKDGHPKHPLARGRERVPDDAPLVPWQVPS